MASLSSLWDKADFEGIRESSASREITASDLKLLAESSAALELRSLAEEYATYGQVGDNFSDSENLKVVTVLHASLPQHTGGYTSRAQGILEGLSDHGVEVVAYTRPGFNESKESSDFRSENNYRGVKYRHLQSVFPRAKGEFQYMLSCVDQYKRVFAEEKPNVVHVRSTYLVSLPASIAAHALSIPVVYEVSGIWELVYEGRGQFGRANRAAWAEDIVFRTVDRIVTMNKAMARLIKDRSGTKAEISLVPNAVAPESFASANFPESCSYDLGYVGSLVDYEGLDLLLEALALLKDRGLIYKLKIVGTGHVEGDLKESAVKLGLQDQVEFTGRVQADEVIEHFKTIGAIVLPRKSTPATDCVTPLKPFEALAAGKPLIVSNIEPLSEIASGGRYAVTFAAGDSSSLAEKIYHVLSDKSLQQTMVRNGFELVNSSHSWSAVTTDFVRVLVRVARVAECDANLQYLGKIVQKGLISVQVG